MHAHGTSHHITLAPPPPHSTPYRSGPTALQLGTHQLNTFLEFWTAWRQPARLAKPCLARGDVLVYSSALIHRGEPNCSEACRPILVFRYDDPETPPPGVGAVGSQLIALYGWLAAR